MVTREYQLPNWFVEQFRFIQFGNCCWILREKLSRKRRVSRKTKARLNNASMENMKLIVVRNMMQDSAAPTALCTQNG